MNIAPHPDLAHLDVDTLEEMAAELLRAIQDLEHVRYHVLRAAVIRRVEADPQAVR